MADGVAEDVPVRVSTTAGNRYSTATTEGKKTARVATTPSPRARGPLLHAGDAPFDLCLLGRDPIELWAELRLAKDAADDQAARPGAARRVAGSPSGADATAVAAGVTVGAQPPVSGQAERPRCPNE